MLNELRSLFGGRSAKDTRRERDSAAIAIVFDIDRLGGGMYGYSAFKIFFTTLAPDRLRGCEIFDGDTIETLSGRAQEYCIAVTTLEPGLREYIKTAFLESAAKGLASQERRINERVNLSVLSATGFVDSAGSLRVRKGGLVGSGWANGTAWMINKES
ncbi:MAG: hypothetical protein JNM66_19120 [Bryobacterales bacterium]|nr:hypothetical protein [Bryobacterales bacterium]